ncbi:hypothetical protein WDA79_03650 [Streptomyces sp. A475]|uniref:hypothetical protein n=1 Tax=Streptomyces sp. A475 TaxID=3131976 RepID=UPI0030C9C148
MADCLDLATSSAPAETGEIEHAVFVPDRIPCDAPCFRLTDNKTLVYWNGWGTPDAPLARGTGARRYVVKVNAWARDHPRS